MASVQSIEKSIPNIRRKEGALMRKRIEVYLAIYWAETGRGPSLQEIAIAMNRSISRIQQHLKILREEGKIIWGRKNVARSIRVTREDVLLGVARRISVVLFGFEDVDKISVIMHELNRMIIP